MLEDVRLTRPQPPRVIATFPTLPSVTIGFRLPPLHTLGSPFTPIKLLLDTPWITDVGRLPRSTLQPTTLRGEIPPPLPTYQI